jgi:hypothetical protein
MTQRLGFGGNFIECETRGGFPLPSAGVTPCTQ